MSRATTAYTVYRIARVTVPTLIDAITRRGGRAEQDRRLHAFGRAVVERARIQLTVRGADRIPLDRAYVYMSNHQSHTDIPILYASVPSPTLRMVAKTELFRVPLFGRAMRIGDMIEVDRSNKASAVESLRRARSLIEDGVSVWIAPEGTRSRSGALAPLKKGGFYLARDTTTPIVPVAISGTYDVLPPKTTHMALDVPVEVEFGAPIPVEGRPVEELMDEVARFLAEHVRPPRGGMPGDA